MIGQNTCTLRRAPLVALIALDIFYCLRAYSLATPLQNTPPLSARATSAVEPDTPELLLRFRSEIPVENLPPALLIMMPPLCNADTLFLDEVKPSDLSQHTVYSVRGKETHIFSKKAISDLHDISVQSVFPTDTQLAILLRATRETSPDKIKRAVHPYFLAEFNTDGSYQRSVELSVDYDVSHAAVLPSGELLVTGFDQFNEAARLDLLDADGKLIRPIDFPAARLTGHLTDDYGSIQRTLAAAKLRGSILLTPYSRSVLVWREGSTDPVIEVQSGGVVREVPLRIPKGFLISDLISANDRWIVHLRKTDSLSTNAQDASRQDTYVYYEVSPVDGSLSRKLTFSEKEVGAIYCEKDGKYTSFQINKENKFVVLSSY